MREPGVAPPRQVSLEEDQQQRYGARYFDTYYRSDPKREVMYRHERARIERWCAGGRIFDVGCGLGSFLAGFPVDRWERYGSDISPVAIEGARANGLRVKDAHEAYDYPDSHFDVIVFRGSLQLLPEPFSMIRTCIRLLKPGGYLVFLSTPNSNSPYYRRFKTLPFLTPDGNYLIPSDIMVRNALQNYGLEVVDIQYPYLETPYAQVFKDHLYYVLSFFGVRRKFAFWRSAMEIYARKPGGTTAL